MRVINQSEKCRMWLITFQKEGFQLKTEHLNQVKPPEHKNQNWSYTETKLRLNIKFVYG